MKKICLSFIFSLALYADFSLDKYEIFELGIEENISILGDINIAETSQFIAREDSKINIDNNWINKGSFIPSTSTVNFTGIESSRIIGNNIFYNFISQKDIVFEATKTQEIENKFVLKDADINSSVDGVYAIINLATVDVIDTGDLKIKDNKIIGRLYAINPKNSVDDGHTILWFDKDIECQNIGSGSSWYDKIICDGSDLVYATKDENISSEVYFPDELEPLVNIVEENTSTNKGIIEFIYENPLDSISTCSKYAKIILSGDASVKTGFISCDHEDPTLDNWEAFSNSKVIVNDTTLENSHSVIVVDVNLTQELVIGSKI